MKAYFITIHVGANFGSVLQTYATQEILKKLDLDVILLNYIPKRVTWQTFWKNSVKPIIKFPYRATFGFINKYINENIYGGFIKKYCKLSKPIYSSKDITNEILDGDIFITGSDQVWNSKYNEGVDKMYFWEFLPENKKRIAFSSSIGKEELNYDESRLFIKFLKNYSSISVRENSARLVLDKLGIKNVLHTLDPTIIIDKYTWKEKFNLKPILKKKYILVFIPYNIKNKEIIYESAKKIAKVKELKIVTFSWNFFSEKYADITIKFADPVKFLSLFYYADYIFTNSFHGTAFSINLNKQVWFYEPKEFATRMKSLISLVHFNDRILDDLITDYQINSVLDYDNANKILAEERIKALTYLKKAIN